ncbi:hypothetical protein K4A83_17230 [Spirulina subsalsa FACHB-351]|uniref:DNA-binding protein n=1 Tax=Spirulina subsalsa FACHB-351 TaxID=234711 RepID=A0ABT3L915_9CYAN|nr:hypothetical protein [Spirulina subsalsa]MCW6038000.1 hypothetical protein [Spirulina subsalsa FACHB-351]
MSIRQLLLFPLVLGSAIACNPLSRDLTPLGEVPNQAPNTTVTVQGTVEQQAPFLTGGAYQIQDPSGNIWVFTEQSLPELGRSLAVTGQVTYKPLELEGLDLGEVYLQELERP